MKWQQPIFVVCPHCQNGQSERLEVSDHPGETHDSQLTCQSCRADPNASSSKIKELRAKIARTLMLSDEELNRYEERSARTTD